MPDQEVLELNLTVKKEEYDPQDGVVQAVEVDEKTSEITMKVIPENVTRSKKAEFTLVDMPKDTTVTGDHITGGAVSTNGELKITVTNTTLPGNYKFTLTSDGKEKEVTLHVLNATMAGEFKVEPLYQTSDINQIDEKVKKDIENEEIYTDISEALSSLESDDDNPAEYSMNINKLTKTKLEGEDKELKHFVAKVRLGEDYKFYEGDELVAVNVKTGEKYITQHSTTEKNSYFVYLDAEELSADIVIANKNSTEEQIKSEYYVDDVVIKVDKSDAILETVNKDAGKPEISTVTTPSATSTTQIQNNQKQANSNDVRAKVSLDENRFNTINLYVKSDLLQKYSLGKEYEQYGSHNWVGIDFQILTDSYTVDDEDIELTVTADNGAVAGIADQTKLTLTKNKKKKIAAWLPADFGANDSYVKTFTVHVKFASETYEEEEETDVTINVYNAGYVYLKSVEAGNEATAEVLESAVTCPTPTTTKNDSVYAQDIRINVKKNGIVPTKYNPKTGKYDTTEHLWVYLKLSYNVPYDWVVYDGKYDGNKQQGTHSSSNKHKEINTYDDETEGFHDEYSEYVWFDLATTGWSTLDEQFEKAIYVTERAICNKYGRRDKSNGYSVDMTTGTRLIFNDYSDTATMFNHLTRADWADNNINFSKITGVKIDGIETEEVQSEVRKAIKSIYKGYDGTEQLESLTPGTWKELLESALSSSSSDKKLGVLSGKPGNLTINGITGRWMLAYLSVRNAEAITTDDNETFILDWADSAAIGGNLYWQGEEGDANSTAIPYGRFALVPVWINLDSKELLKSNLTVNNVTNEYGFATLTLKSDYDKDGKAEETKEINVVIKVEKESN